MKEGAYFLGFNNKWHDYKEFLGYADKSPIDFFKTCISATARILVLSEHDIRFHIDTYSTSEAMNIIASFEDFQRSQL